jgi:hypothetical protein
MAATDPNAGVPALPAGYTLDAAPSSDDVPPLPAGFTLDSAPPETAGRVAGLGARALMQGGAGLAGLIGRGAATMMNPADAAADATTQAIAPSPAPSDQNPPQLSDFVHPAKWQQAAEYFASKAADAAGLPTPATPAERVGSAAVSALPYAALAPEAPIAGALSAAGGGAASQATAEAGGGPVAQTLAGLAAGGLPVVGAGVAGLARTAARGAGADAAAAVQARIANAAENNVPLTAGQATGSRGLQAAEKTSGNLWGGGPIHATAETQTKAIGTDVQNIVDNLNPGGATLTPTGAGEAINTGVAATKQSMRQAEQAAYGKVDALVPASSPVDVSGTLGKLDRLATPTPGAAATTGALVSPTITTLRDNLASDTAANGGILPYSAARQVRTALGNNIDWGFAPADPVTNGALKQVYGALGDDLDAHASAISPQAASTVSDASALYKTNQDKRDLLDTIVNKAGGPEAVYQAATSGTKQGATKIGNVMSALDPQNANVVRATVLSKLGQAVPSAADSTGSFNAATFLTNWNKLAPEAKDALFNGASAPAGLRSSLDSLTQTVSTLRDAGHTLENPSGTGSSLGHIIGVGNMVSDLLIGLFTGHPAALTGLALPVVNRVVARSLVNPRTARWLATTTKLPRSAIPNAVNQLSKMGQATNDPDARDLAAALQAPQPRAAGGPVTAGRPYVVGENGPELVVPKQSGKIGPSPQLASARSVLRGGPPAGVDLSRVKYK